LLSREENFAFDRPIFNERYSYEHEKIADLMAAVSNWLNGWEHKLQDYHINPEFMVPIVPESPARMTA
jgi:hypothetical protein